MDKRILILDLTNMVRSVKIWLLIFYTLEAVQMVRGDVFINGLRIEDDIKF